MFLRVFSVFLVLGRVVLWLVVLDLFVFIFMGAFSYLCFNTCIVTDEWAIFQNV